MKITFTNFKDSAYRASGKLIMLLATVLMEAVHLHKRIVMRTTISVAVTTRQRIDTPQLRR